MESSFIRRIVENCELHPERVAVVDNDGTREMTYGQLIRMARQTVAFLQQKGIPKGSFVTILLPPSAEYMAIEIGLWLSRCVAVPMGDHFPQDRINFIVEHSESALTIDKDVLNLIRQMPDWKGQGECLPDTEDGAILIYTSGSTGQPKGILHNHLTLVGNNPRMPKEFAPDAYTRFGAASPFYFVTILGSYDVLHGGGSVHILSDRRKGDALAIDEYVGKHGITLCHISPAVLLQFHNTSHSLKAVITGGEKLTSQHSQEGYKLFNMFGMSETGGAVMSYEVEKPSDSAPLGVGINQNIARVIDEAGNDAPVDTDGELVLRGSFCAGYFKDPERTEKLYRDGWLHTGDIARRDVRGIIHYVNRKDWMLKINGQRVEPGEIEAAMKRMPGLKRAVVQGIDNGHGSKYLCGYYTLDKEKAGAQPIRKEDIVAYLEQHLPHYMVPLRYVELDAFPLNANGKIDRKNLPLPQVDRSQLTPLQGETELRVAQLFSRVLGMEMADIGANSHFFEEGGDSIRIMTLCGEVRKAFAKEVPPARIYEHPTVREIAQAIDTTENQGTPLDFVYSDHPDKAPLVFIHTGSTGSEAYYALAGDIKDCCSFSVIEQYNIYHPDDVKEGIPAIAAKYIEILKKRQPHGPYNLGGWCYGGMIAYEMACQLKEAGEDMGSLILIDSYIIGNDYDRRLAIANQVDKVDRNYYETNPLFENIRSMGLLESIIENSRRVGQNMVDFVPRPYNGRVHFFKALALAKNLPVANRTYFAHIVRERAGGLEKFIPEGLLTIYEIQEHHDGMMSDVGRKVISNRIRNIMGTEALYKKVEDYWSKLNISYS